MKTLESPEGARHARMGYFVRPMRLEDIAQVADVERECFPTGWSATPFRRELQSKTAAYLVACEAAKPSQSYEEAITAMAPVEPVPAPPASLLQRIAQAVSGLLSSRSLPPPDFSQYIPGYVGLWFITDEAHITAIGNREIERRKGIGELLLISSIEISLRRGLRVVTLETRVSNHQAQALYVKYGFKKMGIRKGYYTDNREDALVMTTDQISSPAYIELFTQLRRRHAERWGDSVRLLEPAPAAG